MNRFPPICRASKSWRDVSESDKICAAHGEKTLIGYDVRESLVYIPPQLEIRVTKFPKYACPNQPECKVTQAERPEGLIEGDRYGSSVPLNIFDFTVSRHRDGPDQFLIDHNFKGVLMGDCYSAYTGISLRSNDGIIHAACNAHARRKIFEARANHPQVVSVLLAMYQELYDIEDRARGLDALSRLNLRQQESAAVWLRMREYLDSDLVKCQKRESGTLVRVLRQFFERIRWWRSAYTG